MIALVEEAVSPEETDPLREMLHILREQASLLISTREQLRRQLAAASLARCRSLMDAMLLLREAGSDDVSGLLRRSLVEHYFLGRYLLTLPDTPGTLIGLMSEDHKTYESILRESEVRLDRDPEAVALRAQFESIRQNHDVPKKPSIEQMARKLNDLPIYTGIYRRESLNGSHASPYGLLAYVHLDPEEQHDRLRETRDPFPWSLWECGLFTAKLGWEIAKTFDLATEETKRILACYDRIARAHPMRDEIDARNAPLEQRARRSQKP